MVRILKYHISFAKLGIILFPALCCIIFCEYLIYYFVLYLCTWPSLPNGGENSLRALILSDPHLLGPRTGHWLDKLRREWQMYRSFQTLMRLTRPEVVFILGDLFDEGQWADPGELESTLNRFQRIFASEVATFHLLGNHDIGFHYAFNPARIDWFQHRFQQDLVKLISIKGVIFVMLNSMAMERDGCRLCQQAEREVAEVNRSLTCIQNPQSSICAGYNTQEVPDAIKQYAKPVLLQHFPLFRKSDAHCNELDEAPPEEKAQDFRPNWECLNQDSSRFLLESLQPRVVLSGHTHHGCLTWHDQGRVPEYSISSFSWRNKVNPAVFLATFSPDNFAASKCFLPVETTVFRIYGIALVMSLLLILGIFCRKAVFELTRINTLLLAVGMRPHDNSKRT